MKKLKQKIESLNLNYKNEILKRTLFNVLVLAIGLCGFFFIESYVLLAVDVATLFVVNVIFFNRYSILSNQKEENLLTELIDLFSYFRIYISNNLNVYTALNSIIEFASNDTQERLNKLIKEIDEDKSIKPFLDFASLYKNKAVDELMISIYEMNNISNDSLYVNHFIKLFEELKKRDNDAKLHKRYKRFDYINLITLLASGVLIILLAFGIVGLIGELSFNGF